MLDWLIVGGGVHGTVVASALVAVGNARIEKLLIVDPEPRPLEAWNRRVAQCGMRFLRSPAAHGVLPDFTAMLRWADSHEFDRADHTIAPYARPSVELFYAHTKAALEASGIASRYQQDAIVGLEPGTHSWVAKTSANDSLQARNVVLALGRGTANSSLRVPSWARDSSSSLPIYHVFDRSFSRKLLAEKKNPVVIGGGVSAAHLALSLSAANTAVTLIARAPLREEQFDSDPCYIGPKCYERYLSIDDPEERRSVIRRVRNPGSIPPDLMRELEAAVKRGSIRLVYDEVTAVRAGERGLSTLIGRVSHYESDACVLATGFRTVTPGAHLLREVERNATVWDAAVRDSPGAEAPVGLRRDSAGRPIPAETLEWAPQLFLTGILAEQELGPTAPNIIGAHNAAKRIVSSIHGRPARVPTSWKRYAPDTASSSCGVL